MSNILACFNYQCKDTVRLFRDGFQVCINYINYSNYITISNVVKHDYIYLSANMSSRLTS